MPQAIKLSQEVVNLVAAKIDEPVADVQAMYEYYKSTKIGLVYIVFDYTSTNTHVYHKWNLMSEDEFREKFRFIGSETPNKFKHIQYL